ncbi:MAG TPA: prenyltransferase [Caldilineaceae bacterium]|nr:prenyltransferase [Caldilineaceae bacterium]
MHLIEREFRATQPLGPEHKSAAPYPRAHTTPQRPPRTVLHALMVLTRAETTPALVAPVVIGAALAWWETGALDPAALTLAIAAFIMSAWGFAVLCDYYDYRYGRRPEARPVPCPLPSGFGLMGQAILAPQTVRDVGRILLAIGGVCSLWLVLLAGWPLLFFSGLSFLVLWAVILLPLRYGYQGWGMGEAGIFLALGALPVLGSYYVQTHTLTWLPVWAALPVGLLVMLLFLNYNTVHYRRDWLIHKRTLAVNLGLVRALDVSAFLTVLAHVGLLLVVTLTDLPLLALMALAALPVGLGVFARLERDFPTTDNCVAVYRTGAHATVLVWSLFCAALLIDKLV